MDNSSELDVDALLRNQLMGSTIETIVSSSPEGGLSAQHPFSWDRIMEDPKGDHGVTEVRGSWYKTMKYEILHSGGFLRLFTLRGRSYWNAQNETEHTTPDWKIHFSCDVNHIPIAWNAIAGLFMDMKCEIGMKATVLDASLWSPQQRGREITVYVYCFHHSYEGYMQGVVPDHDHDLYLGNYLDNVYNTPFWYNFIMEAERRLKALGVSSRGVADGDFPLPGCTFASLRNEAYVKVPDEVYCIDSSTEEKETAAPSLPQKASGSKMEEKKEEDAMLKSQEDVRVNSPLSPSSSPSNMPATVMSLKYPPNEYGWNAACHPNPFLEVLFFLRVTEPLHARVAELESLSTALQDSMP